MEINKIINSDCLSGLKEVPSNFIHCCVTSPPYWGLRDYGVDGQLGMEKTPEEYVNKMVDIFSEVKRVLRDDGTLWLNLGDSYIGGGRGGQYCKEGTLNYSAYNAGTRYGNPTGNVDGYKSKDLVGIPWMVAFALRADGWYLRQDIIWNKPNPMPESVTDRCTKSHEYIFLLSKSPKYYYDYEAILEEATGYDNRKDTLMKGSNKYKNSVVPGQAEHTMASRGHERWKFKNIRGNMDENGVTRTTAGLSLKKASEKLRYKDLQNNEDNELSPVRNKRSVWTVTTKPFSGAHFATFPQDLIVDCIKAGCPKEGIVLDPFMGAGTTAVVARKLNRNYLGFELNNKYIKIANMRLYEELGMYL